ncbi:MAG: hypothetical protein NC120_06135 [Ruminococcus sp.]|nr:hypothetical protein [Ruminococcus sp.]
MDSILVSVKKLLGIGEEYEHFDPDIIMHINSVILSLNQLGVGKEGFTVTGKNDTWSEFLGDGSIEAVKSYVSLKVRTMFDPPVSSAVSEAVNANIRELEWRICLAAENKKQTKGG